jgi:DNA-binding MarR family transcriptional regulator
MPRKIEKDKDDAIHIQRHWHEAVPNDRTAHLVKDATRAFLRALQNRLAPHGVQLGHWTFLRILWEREGITKRDLSAEAGVMEPTTVVALKAMEEMGYVTLERRRDNRKNIYVFLTPLGRSLKDVLIPLAEEVNAIAQKGIQHSDIETSRRTLLLMIDNLLKHDTDDKATD